MGGPLGREQVLDELELLATVEHALVVGYLSVCCALGHDLEPAEGGATTEQGREAAGAASALAVGEMFHVRRVNDRLVDAGRSAQLGRADSIPGGSGAELALGPPTRRSWNDFSTTRRPSPRPSTSCTCGYARRLPPPPCSRAPSSMRCGH
jgi:hypothetical protein